jgi:RHS repeat-associated protein
MLGVTTYTHENNRIATRTLPNGVVQPYVYNANGELISIGGTAHEYTWNETGNLRSYKKDNVTMLGYQTDAMGKRRVAARKETATSTAEITYEVRDLSGQLLYELDENQNVKNYYVSGLNGLSLRIKSNGDYRTYHANLQGSILAMCRPDGSVSHQYDYKTDAYGTVSQKYEEDKNRFQYVGAFGVSAENEDLLFMQARYVSLNDGRFLSEDPIWHANLYPYADNNPVKNIDPKGTNAYLAGGVWGGITNIVINAPNYLYDVVTSFGDVGNGLVAVYDGDYATANYHMEMANAKIWGVNQNIAESIIIGAGLGKLGELAITKTLNGYVKNAIANPLFTTLKEKAIAYASSGLARAAMGNGIDAAVKAAVKANPILNLILKTTPRGKAGVDISSPLLDTMWDITTKGQWQKHLKEYGDELIGLFWN